MRLEIGGMTCGHCERAVTEALRQVSGVDKVKVSFKDGEAEVEGSASTEDLIAAVVEEGYRAKVKP